MKLKSKSDDDWLRDFRNFLYFELLSSYMEARKGGKRATFDEHKFEINLYENLVTLLNSILEKKYLPSRGTAHIIYNPVIREIFAAPFRDRIVHHWIYTVIYDWWDKHFIFDSYSCREGKGTLMGIQRLQHHIRSASYNRTKEVYVITLDVQGYFMSLDRKKLYKRALWGLDRQFRGHKGVMYHLVKYCLYQIIMDDPVKGVKKKGWPHDWRYLPPTKSLFNQPKGVGIVIGNLTSQLLSNIFLDQLDRYVKFELGYKHYGRYVDDFYIVVTHEQLSQAMRDIKAIEKYLKRIGLTLHPLKRHVQPARNGVAFLGAVIYMDAIHPGKRLKKNARKAFREYAMGKGKTDSLISYVGHMKYMKHYKVLSDICEDVGLPGDFWQRFEKIERTAAFYF